MSAPIPNRGTTVSRIKATGTRHRVWRATFAASWAIGAINLVGCGDVGEKKRDKLPAPGEEPAEAEIVREPLAAQAGGETSAETLFVAMAPEQSGIVAPEYKDDPDHRFAHLRKSGMEAGGVAVGDVDGDGLPDIFLASSPGNNRLYRQVSPLKFEDITPGSGLEGDKSWSRGASMADIDNDGDLDLYVANYGEPNHLYINIGAYDGGPVRFEERGAAFGLDLTDASLMPAFCDYDRDGDLDLYVISNHFHWPLKPELPDLKKMIGQKDGKPVVNSPYHQYFRITDYRKHPSGEGFEVKYDHTGRPDYLFRNNGPGPGGQITFTEVTTQAGMQHGHGRGLSATWWDYNEDGHPDLYVGNDWGDRDFLYHNNGDGTFRDAIEEAVPYTSMFTMGSDVGDLNNDGRLDLFVADMSGTTHYKRKISMGAMEAETTAFMAAARPPQNMRNAVYLNTGTGRLMEAAYLMGLANSDWSWAVKIADLDNDGRVDVFVTNGMERNIREKEGDPTEDAEELRKENNLAFRNMGDLRFAEKGAEWGLDHFGFSLAAANCDFDRDGDLDMFVVNRGEPPVLYENTSDMGRLVVKLRGRSSNRHGVGAKLSAGTSAGTQVRRVSLTSGYLSSDEALAHFGLGRDTTVRKLVVEWPSGHRQEFADLPVGHLYRITEPEGDPSPAPRPGEPTPEPLFAENRALSDVRHREREFDDFALQPLLPNKLSQLGPGIAAGDIDGDGDEDFVLGGAAGAPTQVVVNAGGGKYSAPVPVAGTEVYEDMGVLLFDADSDGDRDLFAVSGGVESAGEHLRDRLYLNDGAGNFSPAPDGALPPDEVSGGPVAAADVDRDGDLDLFVGGRVVPGQYPIAARSRLLTNEGGRFIDASDSLAPTLRSLGLVTGATFADVDGDGWQDLLIALEWGPVSYMHNIDGKFADRTHAGGLANLRGWWNGISAGDLDGDGDIDLVATNFGRNTKYHASARHPALLYYGKFATDTMRLVEGEFEDGRLYPVRGKSCSTQAIPHLAEKFLTFHSFAIADLLEIYTPPVIDGTTEFSATTLDSGVFLNDGAGKFEFKALPRLAQIAPGFGIVVGELDGDGIPDLYLAQNFHGPQPETGRMSGGMGMMLRGLGDGEFEPLWPHESGLIVPDDATAACVADLDGDAWPDLLVAINDGPVRCFMNRGRGGKPGSQMISVRIRGQPGNLAAAGARVTAETSDGQRQMMEISAGSGYLSQSAPALFFGGGGARVTNLNVRWPDGSTTRHPVKEGQGAVVVLP